MIYAEVPDTAAELAFDETYILMPCEDFAMRPIRMRACRRLTLSEYRMGHLTAIKLVGKVKDHLQKVVGDGKVAQAELNMRAEQAKRRR